MFLLPVRDFLAGWPYGGFDEPVQMMMKEMLPMRRVQ